MENALPIHHVSFPTQHLLAATFLRFQEFYESPAFTGRTFDWEEYMDWYAKDRGAFTYLSDWSGFNVPSRVFAPFREGRFDPLTRKERWLLDLLANEPEPYYVIGTRDGETDDLAHEVVHGLYTVFPDYGAAVRERLTAHRLPGLRAAIRDMGYAQHVVDDEINAHLLTGLDDRMKKVEKRAVRRTQADLHALFLERFGIDLTKRRGMLALAEKVRHHRYGG